MKKLIPTGASSFTGTKFIELYGSKYDITPVLAQPEKPVPNGACAG